MLRWQPDKSKREKTDEEINETKMAKMQFRYLIAIKFSVSLLLYLSCFSLSLIVSIIVSVITRCFVINN